MKIQVVNPKKKKENSRSSLSMNSVNDLYPLQKKIGIKKSKYEIVARDKTLFRRQRDYNLCGKV